MLDKYSNSLHSFTSDELLPPISAWMTLGGIFLVSTCVSAVILAAFTPYKVTVKAPATFRPTGELRLVQSATQGIIKQIVVKENQPVEQGEILAIVDDYRLKTQENQLKSNLAQNQKQIYQIEAQILALKRQIAAEKDRREHAVISAQLELTESQRDYQERTITTQTYVREAEANLQQAQREFQKTQALLKSAQADLKSTEAALISVIARRNRYQPIAAQGALSQDQYEEAKIAVIQQEQALEAKKAIVEAQKQDIQRLSSAVAAAQAKLTGVSAALNPTNARIQIIKEKVVQEQATGDANLSRLNQELEQLIQRQLELQNQINRDHQELEQIKTEIAATIIRSPISGIVQHLNLRNIGQVVNTAEQIAQISPTDTTLIIKALVPTQDIAKVKIGQEVKIRISACPYPDYGTLLGIVKAISPDTLTTSLVNNNSGQENSFSPQNINYSVIIIPQQITLKFQTQICTLQSGMEGRADIITQEETALTFILRKARLLTNI
jgi:HlyD family secretion protein